MPAYWKMFRPPFDLFLRGAESMTGAHRQYKYKGLEPPSSLTERVQGLLIALPLDTQDGVRLLLLEGVGWVDVHVRGR